MIPDNIFSRLFFEYIGCRGLIKKNSIDLVYTQFGPHWPGAKCPNIAGCAYSNLFYPELDFWARLNWYSRFKKRLIDQFRLQRILSADVRIFETEDLMFRALEQHQLDPKTVHYVKAAASSLVDPSAQHKSTRELCRAIPEGFRVVLLSGYHPNKNIELLVNAACQLKKLGHPNIIFVTTLPEDHAGTKNLQQLASKLGVSNQLYNIGPIPQSGCIELYRKANAAVLPSKLESFSNMIAESWATETPLLISDLSWAKSLCGEGAIYFKYMDKESLATELVELMFDDQRKSNVISAGKNQLENYPTSKERFLSYLSIIEATVN